MFQEIVERYRSGDPDLIQTSFGPMAPFADLLKGINHVGMCECLACHSYQKGDPSGTSIAVPEDMENDTPNTVTTDGKVEVGGFASDND